MQADIAVLYMDTLTSLLLLSSVSRVSTDSIVFFGHLSKCIQISNREFKLCKFQQHNRLEMQNAKVLHTGPLDPPKGAFVVASPSGEIVEGDSVTLSCSSDSNPPAEISWFKGGTFVGSGRIYSISNIRSDHSGEYKCKSRYEHGEKYSTAVTLNVMCELMITCTLFKISKFIIFKNVL